MKNHHVRFFVFILLSPLFFIALDGGQILWGAVWNARIEQRLTAAISGLEAMKREVGGKRRIDVLMRDQSDWLASRTIDSALEDYKTLYDRHLNNPVRPVRVVLGQVTLALGLLPLMMGAYIALRIRRMALIARRSRDALLHSFTLGIRRLPWWYISFSFLLLVVGASSIAAAGSLVFEFFSLQYGARPVIDNTGDIMMVVFMIVTGGACGFYLLLMVLSIRGFVRIRRAVRAAFVPEPLEIMGRSVSESEAPVLWSLVRDVAARIGSVMPDRIMIGLNECFFVTENSVAVTGGQTLAKRRTLYLPLTYLAFMKRREVEAVIGHELGHFMGEDGKYSIQFAPIYHRASSSLIAAHSVDRSGKTAPGIPEYFMSSFHEAVRYWSRLRELAADQIGAKVAGAEAIASSLLRIAALSPRVNEALQICRRGGAEAKGGVLSQLGRLIAESGTADPNVDMGDQQPHPFDSHPPTRQRIAAVGVEVTPQLLQGARDAQPSMLLAELKL